MGNTITEKIIAAHAGLNSVAPGQLVNVKVDLALANDITAPLAIQAFAAMGAGEVFDRDRVVLTPDHFTPNKDIHAAEQCAFMRRFAKEQQLTNYFEVGEVGIEHVLLPEQGLVLPGDLVVGADSHTCTYGALGAFATGMGSTDLAAAMALGETWLKVPPTMRFVFNGTLPAWTGGKDLILLVIGSIGVDGALYRAMEFAGPAIDHLSMDGRFTMANMAIEAGGKNGIFQVDEKTLDYIRGRSQRQPVVFSSDGDADYLEVREYDVSDLEPQVALPHLPSNVRPVSQVGEVELDQVVIGSCTNGREEDLHVAAELLMGREVRKGLRCIILPGTRTVLLHALEQGWLEVFLRAGALVSPPTCGPCLGGHMGILAAGERALATTNRNFVGRMGHAKSEVYLAGPAVAAASAVAGRIISPDDIDKYI